MRTSTVLRTASSALLTASLTQVVQAIGIDKDASANEFAIRGESGVSAQQMFVAQDDLVYILDKTENNALSINGHPAWVSIYDTEAKTAKAVDMSTNTFCACGSVLGDGRWIIVGGNNAVAPGGVTVNDTTGNPYQNANGGDQIRLLKPGGSFEEGISTTGGARWYPTTEVLEDGSVIIIGGCTLGAYINADYQNVPTYEYWPNQASGNHGMKFLNDTMPLNLYPLTWLLPSGKLFMQAAYKTILYDMQAQVETPLPDMPHAVRVYPASGATTMLPLRPDDDYTVDLIFCGGTNLTVEGFGADTGPAMPITQYPADKSCVRIKPDTTSPTYVDDDDLPEGRSMGNFINLPDGRLFLANGVETGTAGYGTANDPKVLPRSEDPYWVVGQSFGDNPVLAPVMYDPKAPAGQRFSRAGMGNSSIPRLYHSSATLLADGSILISGSNPNADVTDTHWGTEYRVEKYYPDYYNKPRPQPTGLPDTLSYGGDSFDVTFFKSDLADDMKNIETAEIVVLRPGYSTHAINFGQRMLQLNSTFDGSGTSGVLHVSQMPPNAGLFQPGPALLFAVVNGVPSIGKWVTVGNGVIGPQTFAAQADLAASINVSEAQSESQQGQRGSNETTSSDSATSSACARPISAISIVGMVASYWFLTS